MKGTLPFALFLLCAVLLHAQKFDMRIVGGATFGQIEGDASAGFRHVGYQFAVGTSFPMGALRGQVLLGMVNKGSYIERDIYRTISLHYVELSFLMGKRTAFLPRLAWTVGVSPAILARASVRDLGEYNQIMSDNYRRMDPLPITVLIAYDMATHWQAYVRWSLSLLSVSKERVGTYMISTSNTGQFNHIVNIGIAYNLFNV